MSIKGKKRETPAHFYENPKVNLEGVSFDHLVPFQVRGEGTSSNVPLGQWVFITAPQNLIITPYQKFIPLSFLREGTGRFNIISNRAGLLQVKRSLAQGINYAQYRRKINQFLADNSIFDAATQSKLHSIGDKLAEKKADELIKYPYVSPIISTGSYDKREKDGVYNYINQTVKNYLEYSYPTTISHEMPASYVYSRQDMFEVFKNSEKFALSIKGMMRTYTCLLDYLTVYLNPFNEKGTLTRHNQNPYVPMVVPVMTPENMVYLKMHWILTGKIDLSRITILVNSSIEKSSFPIGGFRTFYRDFLEPYLLKLDIPIFKIPQEFIQENCFTRIELPKVKNILEKRKVHNEFLNTIKDTLSGDYKYHEYELQSVLPEEQPANIHEGADPIPEIVNIEVNNEDFDNEDDEEAYIDSEEFDESDYELDPDVFDTDPALTPGGLTPEELAAINEAALLSRIRGEESQIQQEEEQAESVDWMAEAVRLADTV